MKLYLVQREEIYNGNEYYRGGRKYWNTIDTFHSEEKALKRAKQIAGHVRVITDEIID